MNRRIDIQILKAPVLDELVESGQVEPPAVAFPPVIPTIAAEGGVNPKPLSY
jgi:hypothetical protein